MGQKALQRVAALTATLGLSACVIIANTAWAYTPTLTEEGLRVRWKGDRELPLAGNPVNRSGMGERAFFDAVVRSLQRWKAASGNTVDFEYWQGTNRKTYEPNSDFNGLSSIYFASNAGPGGFLSSNVLGLTQVWYDTDTGEVLEADIILNDLSYTFTNDPRDTSGYGSTLPGAGSRNVFIENVITHELGHAFGLSHSAGLQSTMLFMESPDQAFLGCDEQVGIRAMYESGSRLARKRGAIEGTVLAEGSQRPVFGAHVLAISRRRGVVLASAITDRSGRYRLQGLEPGSYFLMAEPFFAGAAALPGYYSAIGAGSCGGSEFSRTILMQSAGVARPVTVSAGSRTSAPTILASCDTGPTSAFISAASTAETGTAVFDGSSGSGGFGAVGKFSNSTSQYFRVDNVSGRIELHALGYSLYSPVDTQLRLLDASGYVVNAQVASQVYESESGYVNYDSALIAEDLAPGDYWVEVSARYLQASQYPAGPVSLDSTPFVILTGSMNEELPSLRSELPFNGRCRMSENFSSYKSPSGGPVRRDIDGGGFGFCGPSANAAGGGARLQRQTNGGAIAGWFLPWIFMLVSVRVVRRFA